MTDPTPGVYEKAIGTFNDSDRPTFGHWAAAAALPAHRSLFEIASRLEQFRAKCEVLGADADRLIARAQELSSQSPSLRNPFWDYLDQEFAAWFTEQNRPSDRYVRPNAWPRFSIWPLRLRRGGRL